MENDYLLFNVFKDRGLLAGLIISLLTHFLLFINLPIKEDKLLGDKYIPIEIVDIKSPIIKGDSINQSEKTINKNVSNKENNFKQKSEEKLEKKIDNNKFEDFKKETLNKKVEDSSLNKNTSQQSQLENEKKIRGIEKGCFVVQLLDCNGLGQCTTEEEIEVLYKTLTRKSIYKK